jgi:CheY-like chemotaxis protein/predicted regulator of Ras-like GTPase activity (Roadblock/LC7/MglB family)
MSYLPKKVLIVDDEEILTWIMSKTLSKDKKRYEVIIANDGTKALDIMKKEPIDLVISDIRMPGLSGLDLLEEIKKNYPKTKVIIMTAYGNPDIQKECNKRGCIHYLEKPFKIEELRTVILEAIKETKKGFVGKIMDLQLTDVIQLNCLGRMTTAISVIKDDQEGIIYFKNGEIIHAEVGSKVGEEALFTILSWEGGDFTSISGAEPLEQTISKNWQELLIEGMRRKDEALGIGKSTLIGEKREGGQDLREFEEDEEEEIKEFDSPGIDFETGRPFLDEERGSKSTPKLNEEGGETFRYIPKEEIEPSVKKITQIPPKPIRDRKSLLKQILVDWEESSDEIEGGAIVTLEGIPLAIHLPKYPDINPGRFGAIVVSLFNAGKKASLEAKKGNAKGIFMICEVGSLYIYPVSKRVLLVAVGREEANIGMIQLESDEMRKKIDSVLNLA